MSTQHQPSPQVTTDKSLLDSIIERQQAESATRYMPTLSVKQFSDREKMLRELKDMLVEGTDYGVIPGTEKPTLLKPGAEKICAFFGYAPHYEETSIEDWNGSRFGEPLFYYKYACTLSKNGQPVGEGIGSCNSWESKYRYRWVKEEDVPARYSQEEFDALPLRSGTVTEFAFAVDKSETSGAYGKPAEYWAKWHAAIESGEAKSIEKTTSKGKRMAAWEMGGTLYRVPNEGFPDTINTVQKMAQKRAYIAATLSATGASQYFTQDVEDVDPSALGIDTGGAPVGTQAAADNVAGRKIAEGARTQPAASQPQQRAIPAELKPYFDAMSKDVKQAGLAYQHLLDAMTDIGAAEVYDQVQDEFARRFPRGSTKRQDHEECLLNLWAAYQKVLNEKLPQAEATA